MQDTQGLKIIPGLLYHHDNRDEVTNREARKYVRHVPSYPGVWIDVWGNVWTSIKAGKRLPCYSYLQIAKPYRSTWNRKVRVFSLPRKQAFQVSVARLVLEAWVGPRPSWSGHRFYNPTCPVALRIPFPGFDVPQDGDPKDWEFPDAPYHLHWSTFEATDDLTAYLQHPEVFNRQRLWPLPTYGENGEIKVYYSLRQKYLEVGNPMVTIEPTDPYTYDI